MSFTVTQWDAARRQLVAAIRMYFNGEDAVSIHTLACAAREMYQKHCARTGAASFFDYIKAGGEGAESQLWATINGARNFFKHPKPSLDDKIIFCDADNKAALFLACHDCSMLLGESQPIEVQVFNLWFMATESLGDMSDRDRDAATECLTTLDVIFPGLRAATPEEQLAMGKRLLADATENPKALSNLLSGRLGKSEALVTWLERQVDGIVITAKSRDRMAAGCLFVAIEHHKAIVLLIANGLFGSARAMIRPTFEAYLRGAWLHQCADDGDLELFMRDALRRELEKLIADLEKLPSFDCGTLLKAKKAGWSTMCGFTHTGFQQVIRQSNHISTGSSQDEAELVEILVFSDAMGMMSAIEIARIARDEKLAWRVLEKLKDF